MKKFLLVVLVLLVVAAVIGYFLPHGYSVEESININAKPSKIHDLVGDLRQWDSWTPWKDMDPSVQVTFGKETKGVGASQTWTGKDGNGSLTFTASDDKRGIEYDMMFDKTPAKGGLRYDQKGDTTTVTWWLKGDMEMPVVGGYLALLMPRMVGPEFQKGLSRLKRESEK
jgi:hypothetical protein